MSQKLRDKYNPHELLIYLPCMRIKHVHKPYFPTMDSEQLFAMCCRRPREDIYQFCCCYDCFNDTGHTAECEARWKTDFTQGEKDDVALWLRKHIAATQTLRVSDETVDEWVARNKGGPLVHIYQKLDENFRVSAPDLPSIEEAGETAWTEAAAPATQDDVDSTASRPIQRENPQAAPPVFAGEDSSWPDWEAMRQGEDQPPSPWPQQPETVLQYTDPSPQRGRSRYREDDGRCETVDPQDDAESHNSENWGPDWREEKEDETDETVRTGSSRRPRKTHRLPGEKRRGKPRVNTYKVGIKFATALIAVDLAECHSFVQVCDQADVKLAYLIIFILLCLLFFACVCICKLYFAKGGFNFNSPVRAAASYYALQRCRKEGECRSLSPFSSLVQRHLRV